MKTRKKASKAARKIEVIRSIPADVTLAPQAEAPRQATGQDRSASKSKVRELTWAEFDRMVQELARSVTKRFKPDAVIGVAHGGVFVGGAIATAIRCEFFPVRISRRSRDKQVRKTPKITGEMPAEVKGRRVLVVDDVAASGDTLELALALLKKAKAKSVETACLVSRPDGYQPDHAALVTDGLVVFPWDYAPVTEDSRFDVG